MNMWDCVKPADFKKYAYDPYTIKLHQETLEAFCVAVIRAKNAKGLYFMLDVEQVFQPWVLDQMPAPVRRPLEFLRQNGAL